MNKLRKARPSEPPRPTPVNASNAAIMSRTMQLAVRGVKVSTSAWSDSSPSVSANLQRKGAPFSAPLAAAPRTQVEQYWAARALVAETLVSVHDRHRGELREVARMEEQKREREIGAILRANDERQGRLERLTMMCLVVLLGFVAWLVMNITPERDAKGKPSHFTIPILSPFTSVVEHETGVFGTKAVALFVLVVGIAVYGALRHRLSQWRAR